LWLIERAQDPSQPVSVKPTDYSAVMSDRNAAPLLGDDYGDGIRRLCHTDARAVTQTKPPIGQNRRREGQNAGGRQDSPLTNDDAAIVQRSVRVKDRQKQFHAQIGIEPHTSVCIFL
jgi:hypothetical protein